MKNVKNTLRYAAVALALLGMGCVTAANTPQLGKSPIKDVVKAMTLDEKLAFIHGTGMLLTSSLRHPKCPNGQKEALMTVGQGSASLSC